MLKRRGQSKRWKSEQVVQWLTFLAGQMREHSQTVFFVENLQPTWLPRRWRILYRWCIGLVLELVTGLSMGLAFGLILGLVYGLSIGLVFGLIAGLLAGLGVGVSWG